MQFHDLTTLYAALRKSERIERDQSYRALYRSTAKGPQLVALQGRAECDWLDAGRPYYSVYPAASHALVNIRLDLDAGLVTLPRPVLLLRFPVGEELAVPDGRKLHCCLAARVTVRGGEPGLQLWCDFGEVRVGVPIYSYRTTSLGPGATVEERLRKIDYIETDGDAAESDEIFQPIIRIVVGLCLLADDPDLIEPEPLSVDARRYEENPDPALIEKARRRGKNGWVIGRNLEVSPHYRRPHLGLRWTGAGRAVPKIVPIKGAIIKRKEIVKVPTGYRDEERCRTCGAQLANREELECAECKAKHPQAESVVQSPHDHDAGGGHRVIRSTKPFS